MRILQFGRFWHSQHGGVERHAEILSKQLARAGHDVTNLVASIDLKASDAMQDGYRLVQTPSFGMIARVPITPSQISRALSLHRESPFDLMHLHFPDPLSHLISLLMPKNIFRVISWHSDIVKQKRLLSLYQPFLKDFVGNADAVIVATQAHFDSSTQLPKNLPSFKRHIIPYGLDFEKLKLDGSNVKKYESIKSFASGRKIVFALGRHVYYKGFEVLIEAMREVNAILLLGGNGPLSDFLKIKASEFCLSDRVVFLGRVPEQELAAYFNACDVFCLPSVEQSEAFGLVQLEAMACGKPVVCSQLGNGVNVVNQNGVTGLAVPPRDPGALAFALRRILEESELGERMGIAGKVRADKEFSMGAMTRRHIDLYQSLLH